MGGALDYLDNWTYDADLRMTDVKQRAASGNNVAVKAVHLTYDAASQFNTVTRYANVGETTQVAAGTYTFDSSGDLTNLTYTGTSSGETLSAYQLFYDANHRLTTEYSFGDTASGANASQYTTWAYVQYNYDPAGQLFAKDVNTPAAKYTNWQNAPASGTYSYDSNGNQTQTGFTAGPENKMATANGYTYEYDADGNRIAQWDRPDQQE